MITAATSGEATSSAAARAAGSSSSTTMVSAVADGGTPAEPGSPNVATPEPASASKASECPW
jgi:hypothetical protein